MKTQGLITRCAFSISRTSSRCASKMTRSSGVNGELRASPFLVSPGSNRKQQLANQRGATGGSV